jgi:hypothetical protein
MAATGEFTYTFAPSTHVAFDEVFEFATSSTNTTTTTTTATTTPTPKSVRVEAKLVNVSPNSSHTSFRHPVDARDGRELKVFCDKVDANLVIGNTYTVIGELSIEKQSVAIVARVVRDAGDMDVALLLKTRRKLLESVDKVSEEL